MSFAIVTSFNQRLYNTTGKHLVNSFIDTNTQGNLLCMTEGRIQYTRDLTDVAKVHDISIDEDPLLEQVLADNADVIPKSYGGKHDGQCGCPNQKTHKPACPKMWWNENFSKWFRKVVALNKVLIDIGPDIILWCDCDCILQKKLRASDVESWFRGKSVWYLRHKRKHPETGLVGYDCRKDGDEFIRQLADRFRRGAFREDDRWDDCWQFMQVQKTHPDISTVDIAHGVAPRSQVIPMSPAGPYFTHDKGLHRRKRAYR